MLNNLQCVHQAQILFALMTNTELSEADLGINQKNACLPFFCNNYLWLKTQLDFAGF